MNTQTQQPCAQEGDYTLNPCGELGGRTAVSQHGRMLGSYSCNTEALDAVKHRMDSEGFYPEIWWVSDHGNTWQIDLEGNEVSPCAN
uniref:Uncharacterized protein n=1 Tax=uncultured marine virus TaxID=186617 RepID=A0A0F7L4M2_9VIRU|nr:hypothetical protein [uncultured marine virus]